MNQNPNVLLTLLTLLLGGCAGYVSAPLSLSHPAHPMAAASAQPRPSQTLAYAAANLPSLQAPSGSAVNSGEPDAHQGANGRAEKTVTGQGKVIAIVSSAGQLVVEHGEIKGFMEAMTMGYRTEPASLLDGMKPGDRIKFHIDVQKKAIIKIEKMN